MCGIVGISSGVPLPADRTAALDSMMDAIRHRGPDGESKMALPEVCLGHLRLSVNDTDTDQYPMCTPDGRYAIVFDGRIYNCQELRNALARDGVSFRTRSDAEVLLHLLAKEGRDALNRLNGMFSFLFYDTKTKQWIAARDQFGVKPFYYARIEDEFIFASEIKAIFRHPGISPRRDDFALQQYLTFQFCLGTRTLFEGVRKLDPGHVLIGEGDRILSDECYWDTKYEIDTYHTEEYFLDELRSRIEHSVSLQLCSDGPVGAYLSGGLDSSLVCVLAARRLGSGIPMYHGRFIEGPEYDESEYAREVAAFSDGAYHEVIPGPEDFVDAMPKLVELLDEPVAGPGLFPQYAVGKLASQNTKVVLGGQGGDEIFGGYARYLVGYLEQALKGSIFQTQEEGKHLVTLETIVPHLPVLKEYVPLLSHFWSRGLFDEMDARYFHLIDRSSSVAKHLTQDTANALDQRRLFEEFRTIFNRPDTKSYINKMTHFDQKTLLQALLQIEDRISAAVSLESRAPLLDTRIVDLVTTMPPPLKFQGGRTKHILKKAVHTLLPGKVVDRTDKMGFPVPLKEWMRSDPVRGFVSDTLLSRASLERGIYSREALESMIRDAGVGGRPLWGALCLELWHRSYIDAR